jgi:hypothetical protein
MERYIVYKEKLELTDERNITYHHNGKVNYSTKIQL